jgi:hypothetical protein
MRPVRGLLNVNVKAADSGLYDAKVVTSEFTVFLPPEVGGRAPAEEVGLAAVEGLYIADVSGICC